MKKLIAVTSVAVLVGGLSVTCFASTTTSTANPTTNSTTTSTVNPTAHSTTHPTTHSTTTTQQSVQSSAPAFNFVLQGKTGKIKKGTAENTYVMVVPIKSIKYLLQYSERPHKVSKYISTSNLATIWQHNFTQVPPNGSISANSMHPIAVTFNSIKIKDNNVYFNVTPIDKKITIKPNANLKTPHVFVDSYGGGNRS
jgi:hypothetical protein